MKLKYKPVSIYTHPVLTEYEFNRMRRLWRVGKLASISLLLIPGLVVGLFCLTALFQPPVSLPATYNLPQRQSPARASVSDSGWTAETPRHTAVFKVEETRIK